jgi:hypothetical protein
MSLSEALIDLLVVRLAVDSMFSCELGGSGASLEGSGVESFVEGFALGRELAFVSLRGEECW